MKHLLDLWSLGNKDHTPVIRFLNIFNVVGYSRAMKKQFEGDHSICFIEIQCNDGRNELFRWIDDEEARLICDQINGWINTFVTAAPVDFLPPLL